MAVGHNKVALAIPLIVEDMAFVLFPQIEEHMVLQQSSKVVGLRETDGVGDAAVNSIHLFGIALCGAYIGGVLTYGINQVCVTQIGDIFQNR